MYTSLIYCLLISSNPGRFVISSANLSHGKVYRNTSCSKTDLVMFLDRPSSLLLESSLNNSKLSSRSPSRSFQANSLDTPAASAALRFSSSLVDSVLQLGNFVVFSRCLFYVLFRIFLDTLQAPSFYFSDTSSFPQNSSVLIYFNVCPMSCIVLIAFFCIEQ